MNYITLDEAKAHCRVDITDDDSYLTDLIAVCEQTIANEIGETTIDEVASGGVIPSPLKQAILLMIGHFYNMREPVITGTPVKVPYTLEFLIAPYKNWTVA